MSAARPYKPKETAFIVSERIRLLSSLSSGWGGPHTQKVSKATITFALSFVAAGVVDDTWDVAPFEDGSIVFTNKRHTRKIMAAAL